MHTKSLARCDVFFWCMQQDLDMYVCLYVCLYLYNKCCKMTYVPGDSNPRVCDILCSFPMKRSPRGEMSLNSFRQALCNKRLRECVFLQYIYIYIYTYVCVCAYIYIYVCISVKRSPLGEMWSNSFQQALSASNLASTSPSLTCTKENINWTHEFSLTWNTCQLPPT